MPIRHAMRVLVELWVEIEDPATLIALARKQYARSGGAVDVDGMTNAEALAVADLTIEECRAHPRYVAPEQAIPDAQAAAVRLLEDALDGTGAEVYSSSASILRGSRGLHGATAALRRREPRPGHLPRRPGFHAPGGAAGPDRHRRGGRRAIGARGVLRPQARSCRGLVIRCGQDQEVSS